MFAEGGFVVGEVDSAPVALKRTTVAYAPGGEAMAELVASWLGPAPRIVEDEALQPGHVSVTLGPDFDSIAEPEQPSEGSSTSSTAEPEEQSDDASAEGVDGDDGQGDDGGGPGSSPGGSTAASTTSTTTTTVAGWTPGVAPEGVRCP